MTKPTCTTEQKVPAACWSMVKGAEASEIKFSGEVRSVPGAILIKLVEYNDGTQIPDVMLKGEIVSFYWY